MSTREGIEKSEPNSEKQEIKEHLEYLKKQRYECIDDLPEGLVNLEDPKYHLYKCRTNWWTHVMGRFEHLLSRPDIIDDPAVKKEMDDFLNYAWKLDFQDFRTGADIDRVNAALDVLIRHMEKKADA